MSIRCRWQLIDKQLARCYVRTSRETHVYTYNLATFVRYRKQGMQRDLALWWSLTRMVVHDND